MATLWTSPVYRFRLFRGRRGRRYQYTEVVLDVTGSAPSDEVPGKLLSRVLAETIKHVGLPEGASIVDFGAGKLRNSIYLLEKGFRVYAVEFKELAGKTDHARRLWEEAKKFGKDFRPIIFPHEFLGHCHGRFQLALAINTLSVMPVPAERLLVLASLHDSLRDKGYLLWYAMRGDEDQTNRCHESARLGDGFFTGQKHIYKRYWREFPVDAVDSIMQGTGFSYVRSFDTQGNSQARLYRRESFCPLNGVLTAGFLAARRQVDDDSIPLPKSVTPRTFLSDHELDEILPDQPDLHVNALCVEALRSLKTQRANDHLYHRLVALVFRQLFFPHLRNQKIEPRVGTGRPDIVMTNTARKGFFHTVRESYGIHCPLVFIECKNYEADVGNSEVAQLLQRMSPKRGCLGFLVYRKCRNRKALIDRCKDAVQQNNYILALSDNDLIELLQLHQRKETRRVHDWLDDRLKELL